MTELKVDTHNHVLDPQRFPYADDVAYRPTGQEIGTAAQHRAVMAAYNVRHAVIVGPNSGYSLDNRCLLDAIAASAGRFKGIAVVRNDTGRSALEQLKAAGIIGLAFNPSLLGLDHYADALPLMKRCAELDLFVNVQVHEDQMAAFAPVLLASGAKLLIDHCGRPTPAAGLDQRGFQAVLSLGRSRRAVVKLSGLQKWSALPYPFEDTRPYIGALLDAFGLDGCVWASDWPFLKANERLDVGPLLGLVERWLPDRADRRRVLWETPCRVFGFAASLM